MNDYEYFQAIEALKLSPAKPTVEKVLPLVRYYCNHELATGLGGSLHIFVEDGNVDDNHIKMCKEFAIKEGDALCPPLCDVLMDMSKTQRNEIYNAGYEQPEYGEYNESQPPQIDWTSDSVRLGQVGERVKCMVIMDVTPLTEEQRQEFMNRCLVALTRMGEKVINKRKDRN
jgi:hypothetical protein